MDLHFESEILVSELPDASIWLWTCAAVDSRMVCHYDGERYLIIATENMNVYIDIE